MKMGKLKFLSEKPTAVREAQEAQKGYLWILELLMFIGVFFAAQFAQLIIALPGQFILLFTNADYMAAYEARDMDSLTVIAGTIAGSDVYLLMMLFATVMMILTVWLLCRLIQKRKLRTLGFYKKNAWKEYLKGLVFGFAAFSLAVLLGILTGGLRFEGRSPQFSPEIFLLFMLGFMIQGMAEEVICRGYFLVSVSRRYPVVVGLLMNSLFFAALHLFNNGIGVLAFINLTLFGVFASVYFLKRGNIWGVAAFHSVWNLVQGNFYGIRVSGMTTSCTVFSVASVEGKELLNGGAFGMEGSVWVTLVLIAATVFIVLLPTRDTGALEGAQNV